MADKTEYAVKQGVDIVEAVWSLPETSYGCDIALPFIDGEL